MEFHSPLPELIEIYNELPKPTLGYGSVIISAELFSQSTLPNLNASGRSTTASK